MPKKLLFIVLIPLSILILLGAVIGYFTLYRGGLNYIALTSDNNSLINKANLLPIANNFSSRGYDFTERPIEGFNEGDQTNLTTYEAVVYSIKNNQLRTWSNKGIKTVNLSPDIIYSISIPVYRSKKEATLDRFNGLINSRNLKVDEIDPELLKGLSGSAQVVGYIRTSRQGNDILNQNEFVELLKPGDIINIIKDSNNTMLFITLVHI